MRCSIHCPPAARVPVAAASGVFCAVALAVYWLSGAWVLVLAAVAVLAAVTAAGAWAVSAVSRRLSRVALRSPNTVAAVIRRGGLPAPRWPDRPALGALPLVVEAELVRAPYQIPAPPLAIEAPDRYGVSPGDASAVTVPAVVPGVRDGAKLEA